MAGRSESARGTAVTKTDVARTKKTIKEKQVATDIEELEDFAEQVEMQLLVQIADNLGISTDQCLGRGVDIGVGIVRVQPEIARQLEWIRKDMPFLGDDLHDLANYIFQRFTSEWLGVKAKTEAGRAG